jgi:hypothetical protein
VLLEVAAGGVEELHPRRVARGKSELISLFLDGGRP